MPNVSSKQLYYGRAEVKTSDHRPVSSLFDVDIEIADEQQMYDEYVRIHERFQPSNGQIIVEMTNESNQRRQHLLDEFDVYIKKTYGNQLTLIDRL
jgi:hypothetical protein